MSQKLKRASQLTFGELHLRQYFFDKWHSFAKASMATETIDVALLVWSMRDAFNEWKSLAWPRKFKSRRGLRSQKKGLLRLTSSADYSGFDFDDEATEDKKNEYLWPKQDYGIVSTAIDEMPFNEDGDNDEAQEMWQAAAFKDNEDIKSTSSRRSWFSSLLSKNKYK